MSVPASCVCAEKFDEGVHKLCSVRAILIVCSLQACYSHVVLACYGTGDTLDDGKILSSLPPL